jgi:hypothetical protein
VNYEDERAVRRIGVIRRRTNYEVKGLLGGLELLGGGSVVIRRTWIIRTDIRRSNC